MCAFDLLGENRRIELTKTSLDGTLFLAHAIHDKRPMFTLGSEMEWMEK